MAEVVVVGAGIIGCAVAHELARRGASVTVLEAREPGQGATQASAGVLAPYIEAPGESMLQRLCVEGLGLWDEFIDRVRRDSSIDVEYRRTGTLEVALDDTEADHLRETARALASKGVRSELLDPAEALAIEPALAPATTAALFVPQHGYVNAPALTRALASAAQAFGATFRTGVRVDRVEPAALKADAVIIAAGSWSGQVAMPGAPPTSTSTPMPMPMPVRPVRGQLLHLRRGPDTRLPARVVWGSRCYSVPWSDGTLLVGATVEEVGFAEETTVAGIQMLLNAVGELLPATHAARFLQARVGLRPATPDSLPVIGESADTPGVFYATGHYRNGILLAPLTARMLADAVLERRQHPLLRATSPSRFHSGDQEKYHALERPGDRAADEDPQRLDA